MAPRFWLRGGHEIVREPGPFAIGHYSNVTLCVIGVDSIWRRIRVASASSAWLTRIDKMHIARGHRGYAWRALENCLRAPKTTPSEIGHVCLAALRLRAKCHAQDEDQIVRQRPEEELGFTFDQ